MEFRVLGPLEVVRDGTPLELGGAQQRALLAVLLLNRGEVVSIDLLIDALWGERPPATAAKTVQVYVSRLRKALGTGALITRSGGYLLATAPDQVDLDRFESIASDGRGALEAGDADRAAARLREALAVWRGTALADFAYEPFAQAAIGRLEEERLAALEDRIDADLAAGRHARLVGELDALVSEHPLRERLLAQLMLALYRSGRQADALERYRQVRRRLIDELGIEPGQALRDLERAILAQDPALDAPSSRPRAQPAIARVRGGALIAAGGALLLAAAIAATAVTLIGSGGSQLTAGANSVAVIDPQANRVVAVTPVGGAPGGIAAGVGGVWVVNTDDHTISNLDPASRRVIGVAPVGGNVDAVAADSTALWTVDSTRGVAAHIDPTFRSVLSTVPVGDRAGMSFGPNPIAIGNGAAWVANNASGVTRIADGGARVTQISVGNNPSGIAIGMGATWVTDEDDGTVSRIDPTGGVSGIITVGPGATGITVGAGAVWVANTSADTLERVDPASSAVTTTIAVGSRPRGVAFGDGSVWVANSGDGTVSRVDPQTDRVIATIPVGQSPQAVVVSSGAVWVSVDASPAAPASPSSSPPGVLRVVRPSPFATTDPALSYNAFDPQAIQMVYETCAGLLTHPDRAAPDGTRLVPDAAQAMPSVSADGRTYTFIVRPGFRFSPPSGAPVTAATFKHAIERALNPKLKGYAANFMGDIVGMPAFQASKTAHLAGINATGNRLQIRLTAPAPDLPARIATPPFCATPDDTPDTPQSQPIPSAGPYYIASSSQAQLVLARNPDYSGSRPRVPQRIVYSFGFSLARAITQVDAGRSDYLNAAAFTGGGESALPRLQELEVRYGPASTAARTGHQRYFVNPWLDLEYFAFNTARPLFASARLRRAVNYAIDRRALVQHHFLFNGGRATDHYLVPGIPGSRPVGIYPLGGPDLPEARRLAGSVDAHATLYILTGEPQALQDAAIVQADLKAIGITLDISALPGPTFYRRLATPGEPWDIAFENWGADFPDPFTMINELFDPASAAFNFGRFNDPALTKRMRTAAKLSGERRLQAYARLDEDLTRNDPPAVAWGIGTFREFFSAHRMPDLPADLRLRPRQHVLQQLSPPSAGAPTTGSSTRPSRGLP